MSTTEQGEPDPTCSSLAPKTTVAEPKPYLVVAKSVVEVASAANPTTDVSALVLSSWKLNEREDLTMSSVTSHDRMETLSNFTHIENESVVSSWVDDDDCFMASAMQDIRVVASVVAPDAAARVPLGKGWKIASSNNTQRSNPRKAVHSRRSGSSQGGSQQSAMPSSASTGGGVGSANAPSAAISCGRFDALSSEPKRRR